MKHPSLLRACALGGLFLFGACAADPVTQVFVRVDVEPDVESRIVTLDVAVFGGTTDGTLDERDVFVVDAIDYPWPATLGVVPEGGDASRLFEVHALALDADGDVIAEARGTSTFIEGETRVFDLLIFDDCVGATCLETETCLDGTCFDSFVDPVDLPPYSCPLLCGALCIDDPQYDDEHCGGCDTVCGDAESCIEGVCEELGCDLVCDDECVEDASTDNTHCGMCDNPCPDGDSCVAGVCEPGLPAFEPLGDTILEPGEHRYSRVVVPAGVTVTTTGAAEVRIFSEGDVVIEGRLDLSGGNGGPGADVDGVATGAGGGGSTGRPRAGQTADGCAEGGDGGTGGDGAVGQKGTLSGLCEATAAMSGGGAGGVIGSGGSGGGGYAGGGGGGGATSPAVGGAGASSGSAVGGGGGSAGRNGRGEDPVAGGGQGGMAPAPYGGLDGVSMDASDCTFGPAHEWEAAGGGGGSIGRDAAEDPGVFSTFRAGSGGGGGGGAATNGNRTPGGGGGGGGGGAVRIESATSIQVAASGSILANGGNGGSVSLREPSGGGGGGSGGAIVLQAPSVDVAGRLSARGGLPGMNMCGANGGPGGIGRIRISVGATCSLTGTFEPALADGCNMSSAPGRVFVAPL